MLEELLSSSILTLRTGTERCEDDGTCMLFNSHLRRGVGKGWLFFSNSANMQNETYL